MDIPAFEPAPGGPSSHLGLAALDQRIKELRQQLEDALELIERLRMDCISVKEKLADAERERPRLVQEIASNERPVVDPPARQARRVAPEAPGS